MKTLGLLLTSPKEVGGIYQYSISMIDACNFLQKKTGYNVIYFFSDDIWKKHIPKKSNKIFIKKNFLNRLITKLINPILPSVFYDKYLAKIFNDEVITINKSNCDLIILPSQNRTCYQIEKRNITSVHDLMHRYRPKFSEFSKTIIVDRDLHYSKISKFATGIFVDSKLGGKQLMNLYNTNRNKVFVLPFAPPKYLHKSKKYNLKKKFNIKNKYIFYPAQFWEHKNHINLIKAFKKVKKKNKKILLVFCWAKKNYFNKVKNYVENNCLKKSVFFLGRVDDKYMYSLYNKAEMTVYPSFFGPTNIPPLEALLCKSPLICSDVFAMKEQVGNASLYFNPREFTEISKKITLLLNNTSLRKKLIINGNKIIKKYNQTHFNKLFLKYVKKSLS